MKRMFNKTPDTVKTMTCKVHCVMTCARAHLSAPLYDTRGEGYIDTAIEILVAVVLGILLLAGLHTLLGDTVLPTVTERVEEVFDYKGWYPVQVFLFPMALAVASAVDCCKRTIPDSLCLLTAAVGLISFSPTQFFGVLAALPLLITALTRPECIGGGDIKLTAAAGPVLGFWWGIWGMALGLLLAALYLYTAMLF